MIKDQKRTIFFRSVPNSCSLRSLKNYFRTILKSKFKIQKGKNKGKKKSGFATICTSTLEDEKVLFSSKHLLDGNELIFQKYKTDDELFQEAADMLQKRIYVNNLPHNVKRAEVAQLFSKFGNVKKVFLKTKKAKDPESGEEKLKVNCFVNFENKDAVSRCLESQPLKIKCNVLELYQKLTPQKRDQGDKELGQHEARKLQKKPKINLEKKSPLIEKNNFFGKISKMKNDYIKNINWNDEFRIGGYGMQNPLVNEEIHPHPSKIRGRGRPGMFSITPFASIDGLIYDWMGYDSNFAFSLKRLVPKKSLSQRLFVLRNRHNLQMEDNDEGYDHSFSNLRMNKFGN